MQPFCEQVAVDDLLLLKRPTRSHWHVVAVGRVGGEYDYEPGLEDVEGWELQHVLLFDERHQAASAERGERGITVLHPGPP